MRIMLRGILYILYLVIMCTAVVQWFRYCAKNRKVPGSIPAGVSGFFIDMNSFRSHYGPGVDSASVAQWLRCCATNWEVPGSIPAGVSGFFIDIKSFRSHYDPGVDSASVAQWLRC